MWNVTFGGTATATVAAEAAGKAFDSNSATMWFAGGSIAEQLRGSSVQIYAMSQETFPIELVGGSRDGEVIDATAAPDHVEVPVDGGLNEIYERQNDTPPFVYVQIGYAVNETWK